MLRRFTQVDVFASGPYTGNPLAVVLDGEGLSTEEMQRFARWTNLSETTFLLPPTTPEADYRVRIFTPDAELPFAGHPTLGSCHAWLEAGGEPREKDELVQEGGVGLVRLSATGGGLSFQAPPLLRSGPVDDELLDRIIASLGITRDDVVAAEWADNGPGWVGLLLADAEAVLALRPGTVPHDVGVVGLYPEGSPCAYEVRAFFPSQGATVEDPVTGSLNGSLAQWLLRTGRVKAPYVAAQGTAIGRAGRVRITTGPEEDVWVGGDVITSVTGQVEL
ncbi:PhzF family phenazine biosynthesis protein [Nonomuraea sp. FMUSA5-5]|uniref:PhzF family phenazine biosynthesis protein n=1 Tax=Nonomuraea composti TaxID=2720023 RepID=A0ABX1BEC4_9ACTN|nr:PhzF family phenazine biosynthesis protein [Nonomuraea sp. FMUSA5-5]NJP95222.1 PhzF family phenazine biosynthesis protein [Nonomuraea sp. FMUSA5-5]